MTDVKALRALLDKATELLPPFEARRFDPASAQWNVVSQADLNPDPNRPFCEDGPYPLLAVNCCSPKRTHPNEAAVAKAVAALLNSAPDLLALAEAVRDLAGPIAMLVEHGDIAERDAARRVLAILEGK